MSKRKAKLVKQQITSGYSQVVQPRLYNVRVDGPIIALIEKFVSNQAFRKAVEKAFQIY